MGRYSSQTAPIKSGWGANAQLGSRAQLRKHHSCVLDVSKTVGAVVTDQRSAAGARRPTAIHTAGQLPIASLAKNSNDPLLGLTIAILQEGSLDPNHQAEAGTHLIIFKNEELLMATLLSKLRQLETLCPLGMRTYPRRRALFFLTHPRFPTTQGSWKAIMAPPWSENNVRPMRFPAIARGSYPPLAPPFCLPQVARQAGTVRAFGSGPAGPLRVAVQCHSC